MKNVNPCYFILLAVMLLLGLLIYNIISQPSNSKISTPDYTAATDTTTNVSHNKKAADTTTNVSHNKKVKVVSKSKKSKAGDHVERRETNNNIDTTQYQNQNQIIDLKNALSNLNSTLKKMGEYKQKSGINKKDIDSIYLYYDGWKE